MPERPNFPREEEKVLQYWNDIDAFQKQLEMTKGMPEYTFYDGPPFATGLPHYGHIAAGTIKVRTMHIKLNIHAVECETLPMKFFAFV